MKISVGSKFKSAKDLTNMNGFGYATDRMISSLETLGYQWDTNDASADVEIFFEQPHNIKWSNENQYKICYMPWESTALNIVEKDHLGRQWKDTINSADEVWTPSPLIANWFKEYMGITKPIFVYEHGVDPIWMPKKRKVTEKFKFLHVGFEAVRKGGRDTMKAYRVAFPNNNDVELTMKTIPNGWHVGWMRGIRVMNEMVSTSGLVDIFHDHHAYVYPSYGEGFGLTPLQALATGMPTITLPSWAPYSRFLDPDLSVDSHLMRSPWPQVHPGMMFQPKFDDIVDSMRFVYNNYEAVHERHLDQVEQIQKEYDWNHLTKQAFSALEKRLENN